MEAQVALKAVILDWAGTTIDYGCMAPTIVFIELFEEQGVPITLEEARTPMGMYKRDHIAAITRMQAVAERWQQKHGRLPDDSDVQRIFEAFAPRQLAIIAAYTTLIPGVTEAIADFRARGLKIGSCTGYTRQMMDVVVPEAAKRGYQPDAVICPDDVPAGRPAPWMCYMNAMQLNVFPQASIVKIGDTLVDIAEGLNAGVWTIGLAKTGNELGLSEIDANAILDAELREKLRPIYTKMTAAGAHYVVDGLADVPAVLDEINTRLAQGEKP